MRDPKRIDRMLELLRQYWQEHPDLRLAQIVYNLAPSHFQSGGDVYYFEDDLLEAALRKAP